MTTVNQGMSVEEIKQVVAERVANAIEAIAIYEAKTNISLKSMSQTKRQEEKVAENASNKKKWGSNHNESLNQQNKGHKVPRAHTAWPINKKAYAGSLPLCNQCKFHHNGTCTAKCGNYKKVGHIIQNFRTPATAKNQRTRTCYECGSVRHYKASVPVDSVLSADFWFHPRILPSVRKATDAAKSANGLSSVISIDLADQVFEGIGARQLVVKKEPAFFNLPEEKVLLYTHRGKLLKDEATARGRESKGLAVAISHSPS
nr:hypothetical protein [Tanacetum cinerariifolium]